MFLLIALLIVVSIFLILFVAVPIFMEKLAFWQTSKEKKIEAQLDNLFYDKNPKQLVKLYFILPPILAVIGLIASRSIIIAAVGAVFGLFVPNMIIKFRNTQRMMKFNSQILDAIMILSSSLKGGLSLLQAFEVLIEEMPAPMSQEVGLVVRENKMGLPLEESLRALAKRINQDELSLVINSILVARETGGDLTKVFSRLSTTIRDNRKLKDSIATLTMQGKLQGMIMSALPFMFVWWVLTFNKEHFNIMLQSELGRMLLGVAIFLQIVGLILIKKFSIIRI